MTHSQSSEVKAPKVSVIVPVYNTELYVERAIISLMEQTLDDVQFIIIDDGSKDNSLHIIKQVMARYPARSGQVTLISRENRGVAATRAQGMELATGDYVIHLDSDDWAELNWLEAMYTKAIEENADVVVCDYRNVYATKSTHIKQPIGVDGVDCVKKLLEGQLHGSTCNKLVRRALIIENNLTFLPDINYMEDYIYVIQVFLRSLLIKRIALPLYNYNQVNVNSVTYVLTESKIDDIHNAVKFVKKIITSYGLLNQLERSYLRLCLSHKAEVMYLLDKELSKKYCSLYDVGNLIILSSSINIFYKTILLLASVNAFNAIKITVFLYKIAKIIRCYTR